jgi:uncharacterized membrane protein
MMLIPILLVLWLIFGDHDHRRHEYYASHPMRRDSLAIVKERYARGEITKEQFEQYKADLRD